jgi:hypothetical protein
MTATNNRPRGATTRALGIIIALFFVAGGGLVGISLVVLTLARRAF